MPIVTISAIDGRTRGFGSEFILATDIRFATENAIFSQIEVGTGIFPGGGAIEKLPRLMGSGRALEIILGSDDYDAKTAELYGWINRVIPKIEFDDFINNFANRISGFDKQAIFETKKLLNKHTDTPTREQINETQKIFFNAYTWDGAKKRMPKLKELGSGVESELELNYGKMLGTIDFEEK